MRDTLIFGQAFQGGASRTLWRPLRHWRMMRKSAAATASARARSPARSPARSLTGLDDVRAHTKASASCGSCTGAGRATAEADARRQPTTRLAVQPMCSCTTLGHDDVRRLIKAQGAEDHSRGHAGARMEDVLRLRQMPAGAQLLSHRRLAGRICRRLPVAFHQRARPRQHPEGRHLFGRAAHVGRHDLVEGAARHRRCRRQVRRSRP